ncbi:MAG: hypothetical protein C0457_01985 [Polymorphum sp.]|jgi:uncharacterized protein|nr:hypothetical protein [Polymorphum sp.]
MTDALFALALAVVALFYSAVGQAGGTGYVAVMGLSGFDPATIKPTALALNVLVSAIGCYRFYRAGMLTWRTVYPFAVLGAPFSLLGGALHLPASVYMPVVGMLLLIAGVQMLRSVKAATTLDEQAPVVPPFLPSLLVGGVIGLVSGVTGVGGGIFLAPVVLAMRWTETRAAAAISAVFNLLNSGAALLGAWATMPTLPAQLPIWLACVAIGGLVGSWLGARYLKPGTLRLVLAALLLVAAVRMIATSF